MEMLLEAKRNFGTFLEQLADTLDLTEGQHKTAKEKYTSVANFLAAPDTLLTPFDPRVLVQGSVRIGTTVRPIGEDAEFDIDMTCILSVDMPAKQEDLRNIIEERLRESSDYKRMLSEEQHRRCLRLHYAESLKFHLDIVPAIPDDPSWIQVQGVPEAYAKHAILISDADHDYFDQDKYSIDWPKSNTEGYALWFLDRMKIQADRIRMELKAQLLLESVDDVPEYKVRTPLQRGIQLMKRHRDMMFKDDCDNAPVSIIITTLAAKAYEKVISASQSTIFYDILIEMIDAMPTFIKHFAGEFHIENPVNHKENFADKWNETPKKARNFIDWITAFKNDFQQSFRTGDIQKAISSLRPQFGDRIINEALNRFEPSGQLLNESKNTSLIPNVAHRQMPLWPVRPEHKVRITAKYKSHDNNWTWTEINERTLEKGVNLMFNAYTDVPEPFNVFWQVVNTGAEARDSGCLRGAIFPAGTAGTGGLQQPEATSYSGLHWVECFIVKNGICVARSGESIIRIR